jgi:hypothetical protein
MLEFIAKGQEVRVPFPEYQFFNDFNLCEIYVKSSYCLTASDFSLMSNHFKYLLKTVQEHLVPILNRSCVP